MIPQGLEVTLNVSNMTIVDLCRSIALMAHGGDKNKHDGELYLLHVNRVAVAARLRATGEKGLDQDVVEAIAWLHDVVEDTPLTPLIIREILTQYGINATVVDIVINAVDALTKRKNEPNEEYYHRVRLAGRYAIVVKLEDLNENFSRNHLILDDATRLRMSAKYSLGMFILR